MNNQLIAKIITANNFPCPTFTYQNPVLDSNVAKTLAKSFVKILNLSQQNSKVNNNLRHNILENIRKLCQSEPENHTKMNEDVIKILSETFEQQSHTKPSCENSDEMNKNLDAFLIRSMKELDLNSEYKPSLQPETIQALLNLNQNEYAEETLLKDLILWKSSEQKNIHIIKNLWLNKSHHFKGNLREDIAIKLKSQSEEILIEICQNVINDKTTFEELIHKNTDFKLLVHKSSESSNCFQICCSIYNYIFIMTNFNPQLLQLIQSFINFVKIESCYQISSLYSNDLSHIVLLLDMDLGPLPIDLKMNYIQAVLPYLSKLHLESESDLIMLLSHFSQWFDIYFEQSMSCEY